MTYTGSASNLIIIVECYRVTIILLWFSKCYVTVVKYCLFIKWVS